MQINRCDDHKITMNGQEVKISDMTGMLLEVSCPNKKRDLIDFKNIDMQVTAKLTKKSLYRFFRFAGHSRFKSLMKIIFKI